MLRPGLFLAFGGLLLVLTSPALTNGQVDVEPVSFTDSSAPVCDVNDAAGPDELPDCGVPEAELCVALGCPGFDFVERGPIAGFLNGEGTACFSLGSPDEGSGIIELSGCGQIIETGTSTVWRGPITATVHPMYGGFGDAFMRAEDGSTIRGTFTQLAPSLTFFQGILMRLP